MCHPPLIDDRLKEAFELLMSLNMLIETPGGFDYTGADCVWLDEGSRFRPDTHRASCEPRFHGGWSQVTTQRLN